MYHALSITHGICAVDQHFHICRKTVIVHTKWDKQDLQRSSHLIRSDFTAKRVMNFWFSDILGF